MAAAPKIEMIAPKDLKPYERNARTHSSAQLREIKGSIEEFGFRNPVLIDAEGEMIAGHGRVEAALELGLARVPCVRYRDLTDEQKRAYRLADNRIALNAGWDQELLALELRELSELSVNLDFLGFSQSELDEMFGQVESPSEFKEVDDETIETEHTCPKCGYEWSGRKAALSSSLDGRNR